MTKLKERLYLFPLIGVLQGLALTHLVKLDAPQSTSFMLFLFALISLAPSFFYYTYERKHERSSLLFSIVAGALFAGLFTWGQHRFSLGAPLSTDSAIGGWHFWAALVPAVISLIYFRALRTGNGTLSHAERYRHVHDNVWTLFLGTVLAIIFMGLLWLLLFLWWSLFGLIGITLFEDILTDDYVAPAIIFGALATGIGVTLEQGGIVNTARSLVQVLLKILSPIVVIFLAVFLCFLPFTGLDPLWDTRAAAAILISMVFATGWLINASIEGEGNSIDQRPTIRRLLQLGCLLLPAPTLIACIAIWLRIDQYGLTPDRVAASAITLTAGLFAGGYGIASLFSRTWPEKVRTLNFAIIPIAGVIGMALLTPIADPYQLSLSNQLSRLKGGKVSPDDFDLGLLKFELGAAGRQAIEEIRNGKHLPDGADMTKALAAIDQATYRYDWRSERPRPVPAQQDYDEAAWRAAFIVRPVATPFPDNFARYLHTQDTWTPAQCSLSAATRCAFLVGQVFPDEPEEIILITGDEYGDHLQFQAFRQVTSDQDVIWHQFAGDFAGPGSGEDSDAIWQAIVDGKVTYTPAHHNMIDIGDELRLLSPVQSSFGPKPGPRPGLKPVPAPLPKGAMTR